MKTTIKVEIDTGGPTCWDCNFLSSTHPVCLLFGGILERDPNGDEIRCQQCLDSEVK